MSRKELVIQLENPIRVSNKGNLIDVEILQVKLPTVANFNLYADVKNIVMKSIVNLQDKINTNASETTSDDELKEFPLELFFTANTISELSKAINKYLVNNGYWDSEIKVTEPQINKLAISDYNKILSEVSYFLFQV